MRRRLALSLVTIGGVAAFAAAPAASAQTREYWVAAVPVTWNMIPNQFDDITGTRFDPVQTVMPTVVYRRFTAHWGTPLSNTPESGNQNLIPGPLLRARVGDRILVHFKNLDFALRHPHSMHFHGVRYKPSSDGAYVPGVSGRDGDVMPGQSWTYRLTALPTSVGVWPYHDHSPSMHDSIMGGMYGMLSIIGRHEARPDREFVVVFTEMLLAFLEGRAASPGTPDRCRRAGPRGKGSGRRRRARHRRRCRWIAARTRCPGRSGNAAR